MSNATIMEWMELKTENLYTKMRDAMDTSNSRVAAEDALNGIKGKIDDLKAGGGDPKALRDEIQDTIAQYGAEFPEVSAVLQPIASELSQRIKDAEPSIAPASSAAPPPLNQGGRPGTLNPNPTPGPSRGGTVTTKNGGTTPQG